MTKGKIIKTKKVEEKFLFVIILIIFILSTMSNSSNAQVKNSIYSMFGVGELVDNNFGINRTLGGTGIAFQSGRSINYLNPASYLGILSRSYIMEAGIYGIYNKAENKHAYQTGANVNISYFSASFYFADWWAFSFGIVPFSSVDYEINSTENIEGDLTSYEKNYKGSGGLNKIYFGNSFKIFDGLSAGFNASYIVGPISLTETASSSSNFSGYEIKNKRIAYSLYLDYGLQYSINDDDWMYTFGLIYGASKKMHTTDNLEFTYEGTTTSLDQEKKLDMSIPQKIGIGFAVKNGNKFRAGLDYEWAKWSAINFSNSNLDTKNSNRFSIGLEYYPAEKRDDDWYKKIYYRFGANCKNTYLKIDKTPINSFGLNIGAGIPYDFTSTINLSVEYGQEGTLNKGLIKNNYWIFYFSFSLPEFWSSSSVY